MKKIAAIFLSTTSVVNMCCINSIGASENVTADSESYADGTYTGSSYGYYQKGAKRYPIKVDVTISNGIVTKIAKHPEGEHYIYPDDVAFVVDSEKILEILGTGNPKSILDKISMFEAKAAEGQNAVSETEFDAVTGATRSALGLTGAIKDALSISNNAAVKLIKKEVRIVNPEEKTKSLWRGDKFDLSNINVEVTYSDETKEIIPYSDFSKKGLELKVLLDDESDIDVNDGVINLEVPNKAYDVFIKDKYLKNIKDSFRIVAKDRFFIADNLLYKINGDEFKVANFEKHTSPSGHVSKEYIIEIDEEDYGKTLELKSTDFHDYSDNTHLEEEYAYENIKISQNQKQVFLEARGRENSEDNIYVYPKKFDSSAIRVVFREKKENKNQKEALVSVIEKYRDSDSEPLNKLVKIAKEAIDSDNKILENISNVKEKKVELEAELKILENIKIDLLEGREPTKPDKYKEIENTSQVNEKLDEIYIKLDDIYNKIDELESGLKSEDELKKLRLSIIREANIEENDLESDLILKKEYISKLRINTDQFKSNFSILASKEDESLEKKLYVEKIKKAEKILKKNIEDIKVEEYRDILNQLEKASNRLEKYKNSSEEISKNSNTPYRKKNLARISGIDRYESSALISKNTHQKSDTVILVNGESEVDALLSTPLASVMNCPILLIKKNEIPESVKKELERLEAKNIILVGGSEKISDSLYKSMKNMKISRIAGKDRVETSKLMAEKIYSTNQIGKKAILVNGNKIVDAISSSNIGRKEISPILLTENDNLYEPILKLMKEKDIKDVTIIGGSDSIGYRLENLIRKEARVHRFAGKDRYETALILAKRYSNKKELIITSGENLIDALITPTYAINRSSSLVLTRGNKVEKSIKDYIKESNPERISIVGGNSSVSLDFEKELNGI